ncbi:hypothetical protein DASB73_030400 [Starmerella bacillaris]|uniref:Swiss Army Knife RNA repair protein HAD domain-containing protein n=1 Tax=Starmerella bacillaris TaxID=1247836 RepID=A0AAV5RLU6_STABA|nr:hypothetical protein DASB73_030400 [Starmerella bacillaris]
MAKRKPRNEKNYKPGYFGPYIPPPVPFMGVPMMGLQPPPPVVPIPPLPILPPLMSLPPPLPYQQHPNGNIAASRNNDSNRPRVSEWNNSHSSNSSKSSNSSHSSNFSERSKNFKNSQSSSIPDGSHGIHDTNINHSTNSNAPISPEKSRYAIKESDKEPSTHEASDINNISSKTSVHNDASTAHSNNSTSTETLPGKLDPVWCLTQFELEKSIINADAVTDIVIINFDRCLFNTPRLNGDLFDKNSRIIVEQDLLWNKNKDVLRAISQEDVWNGDVRQVAQLASKRKATVLAITTTRSNDCIKLVKAMCVSQGINKIDHMCTSTESRTLDASGKQAMFVKLIKTYPNYKRIFVFEPQDQKRVYQKVYETELDNSDPNSMLFCNVTREHFFLSPVIERKLVEKLIRKQAIRDPYSKIQGTVVSLEYKFILYQHSALEAIDLIKELFGDVISFVHNCEVSVMKGSLNPGMAHDLPEPGTLLSWGVNGYSVDDNSDVWFYMVTDDDNIHISAKIAVGRIHGTQSVPRTDFSSPYYWDTFACQHKRLKLNISKR